jgi:alpha,alpha-trehalase
MPFRSHQISLGDYGLVGNLHTAALISRFGSIDWACLPRFASPSLFARLIDAHRGGYHQVVPTEPFQSTQRYRPGTCVLETRFRLARHRSLVAIDFMPIAPGIRGETSPMIVRMLRARGGAIRVATRFVPRFDYGRHLPSWRGISSGLEASHGASRLRYRHPTRLQIVENSAVGRIVVTPSDTIALELIWGIRRPGSDSPDSLLRVTEGFWRAWVHHRRSRLRGSTLPEPGWVERSELTLKLLSHEKTGAFVAAPTTSIPEWPGGRRNWDYRYAWIRDATFACESMLVLGHHAEARSFLRWVFFLLRNEPDHKLHVMYGAHGETRLQERSLPHLSGLWDSRPVRVGNLAYRQFQLDIYGELLDAALIFSRYDPAFIGRHWTDLARLADQVTYSWRRPDRGIWEVRTPPVHFIHSKVLAWVALDRATKLGIKLGRRSATFRWAHEAWKIRDWVFREGYDPETRSFRRAKGESLPDAANLRIPLVGFLPFEDPRVIGTVHRILRDLCVGPFVYRYGSGDGVPGAEGAFLPASFWLVECLARQHRKPLASDLWRRLLRSGTSLGLFSEEYDPAQKRSLGNFPQALTHIALLRAAHALSESD